MQNFDPNAFGWSAHHRLLNPTPPELPTFQRYAHHRRNQQRIEAQAEIGGLATRALGECGRNRSLDPFLLTLRSRTQHRIVPRELLGRARIVRIKLLECCFDDASDVFNWHLGIDAVLVVEIDMIGPQLFERLEYDAPDALGPTVESNGSINGKSELCGNLHLVAKWLERFADERFIDVRTADLCGIEESHASFKSTPATEPMQIMLDWLHVSSEYDRSCCALCPPPHTPKQVSRYSRFLTLASAAVLLLPGAAFAQPTAGGAPPAGSTVINFNALLAGTPITTQFAAFGVTISGGACAQSDLTGSGTSFTTPYVANYLNQFTGAQCPGASTTGFIYPALTFTFASPIQYFGVNVLVNYNRTIVDDRLFFTTATGSLGLAAANGNAVPAKFVAIQDVTPFTSVTLSTGGNGVFLFDNLTFSPAAITAVPEPSTWVLMGMGLLALGGVAAGRRKRSAL